MIIYLFVGRRSIWLSNDNIVTVMMIAMATVAATVMLLMNRVVMWCICAHIQTHHTMHHISRKRVDQSYIMLSFRLSFFRQRKGYDKRTPQQWSKMQLYIHANKRQRRMEWDKERKKETHWIRFWVFIGIVVVIS